MKEIIKLLTKLAEDLEEEYSKEPDPKNYRVIEELVNEVDDRIEEMEF